MADKIEKIKIGVLARKALQDLFAGEPEFRLFK
jgi:hypothetical protein